MVLAEGGILRLRDEHLFSDVDDVEELRRLAELSYGLGATNANGDWSFAWPGSYRPRSRSMATVHPNGVDGTLFAKQVAIHYAYQLSFVADFLQPDARVLDCGCGAGQRSAMLARYCASVLGVDADPRAVAIADRMHRAQNLTFSVDRGECVAARDLDAVFLIEVLEHLHEDEQAGLIDHLLGCLRPGGLLFVTTPDEEVRTPPHVGTMTDASERRFEARWGRHVVAWDALRWSEGDPFDPAWNPRRIRGAGNSHRIVMTP